MWGPKPWFGRFGRVQKQGFEAQNLVFGLDRGPPYLGHAHDLDATLRDRPKKALLRRGRTPPGAVFVFGRDQNEGFEARNPDFGVE